MRKNSYGRYLLVVLLLIYASNWVDRIAMGLMLQDIKTDLALSDSQLGLMTGIAFALFYSIMGIPIARWADRGNRVTVIAVTTALWGVAVSLCATAGSFWQLLLIRVGVAVGEAGCMPPALSLISDQFGREERPRAVARYMFGGPLALFIAYFCAGWLNDVYGWRTTFALLGVPGVGLSVVAWLTLREPRKLIGNIPSNKVVDPPGTLARNLLPLWQNAGFRHLLLCLSLSSFFAQGITQWQPAFFMRSYGVTTTELGTWFAFITGIGGFIGTYLGGELASRYARGNEGLQLRGAAILYACLVFVKAGVYMASTFHTSLAMLAIATLAAGIGNGPIYAAAQTLVPPHQRALSLAVLLFFSNLVGLGLGPLAIGAMSDAFHTSVGDESLRFALLIICPGYFWAAWHMLKASRAVELRGVMPIDSAAATSAQGDGLQTRH